MPTPFVEKVAKSKGKPVAEIEALWNRAKARAKDEGHGQDYAYITSIFKKMAHVSTAAEIRLAIYESMPLSPTAILPVQSADPNDVQADGRIGVTKMPEATIEASAEMGWGLGHTRNNFKKSCKSIVSKLAMVEKNPDSIPTAKLKKLNKELTGLELYLGSIL
jgi:hypothetical protein